MTQPLSEFTTRDWVEILGINRATIQNAVRGDYELPEGAKLDMDNAIAQKEYWIAVFENFVKQGGVLPHPKVVKAAVLKVRGE